MQYYVHNTRRHHGEHNEHYHALAHCELGYEHTSLVHQELEELRHFAPLSRKEKARRRGSSVILGTGLSTAKTKLSTLVRYVYLSLF